MKHLIICALLFVASSASAQEARVELSSPSARHVADVASLVTAIIPVALDVKTSWDCADRARCFELQSVRIGVTYGAAFLAKTLVHRARPCAPDDCGIDNPNYSFFSAHTAIPFTAVGGPRLAFVLSLGVTTGGLRVAAGKHWISDTLVGAGVGLLTSRIR